MRISDALIDIAATVGPSYYGVATAATVNSVTDALISVDGGEFIGGLLVIASGDAHGDVRKIVSNRDGVIVVDRDFSETILPGDNFFVSPVPYQRLLQALNSAANSGSAILTDATLVGVRDTYTYSLPAGVSNVLRVAVENSGYNRYWHELGNTLVFSRGKQPAEDAVVTLYYRGRVTLNWTTDEITTSVNPDWMKWAGVAQFWRAELEITHKDNPVAVDMMNEARTQLAQATSRVRSMDLSPDPRYFAV